MKCAKCRYQGKCGHDSRFLQADSYIEERFFELCIEKNVRNKLLFDWVDIKGAYMEYTDFSRSDAGNYSKHDYSHSLAILNAVVSVLGKDKVDRLNVTDLWMLLHCAYGHDVGMPYTFTQMSEMWSKINENKNMKKFFRDALESEDDDLKKAAQYIEGLSAKLNKELVGERQEGFDIGEIGTEWPVKVHRCVSYLTTEFARRHHAERSKQMIEGCELFSSKSRLKIEARLYKYIAQCCYMHTLEREDVLTLPNIENDIETGHCHPRFIAYMLRLGDLLDISNNRFDLVDLMHYGNLPDISELHKKKHEAIEHINFTDRVIEITARSDSEKVCQITNDWFSWIKDEVGFLISHWAEFAPEEIGGCTLSEPDTKVYLNDEIFYRIEDCEFHVDKDTLIDLVIGRNLYKTKFDFMKEYIQNALDATKMKFWIDILDGKHDYFIKDGTKLKEKNRRKLLPFDFEEIVFKQYALEVVCDYREQENIEDGNKKQGVVYVEILDKGIGIDKECVEAISNIGSGWRKRKRYAEYLDVMPKWLKPTGGFGIGMQSGFMIADEIQIESRCEDDVKGRKIGLYSGKKNGRIEERDYPVRANGTKIKVGIPYSWFMDVENYKEYSGLRLIMDNIDFMDPAKTMDRVAEFIELYLKTILGDPLFPAMVRQKGRKPQIISGFFSGAETKGELFEWEQRKYMVFQHDKENINTILIWDMETEVLCEIELSDKSNEEMIQEWYYKGVRVWTEEMETQEAVELYRYIGNFRIDIMGSRVKECLTIDRNRFKNGFDYREISNQFAKVCLGYLVEKKIILQSPLNGRKFMRCMVVYKYLSDGARQLVLELLKEISKDEQEAFLARDDMLIYSYQYSEDAKHLVMNYGISTLSAMCNQLYESNCIYWGRNLEEYELTEEEKKQFSQTCVWEIGDEKLNGIIALLEEMLFKLYSSGAENRDEDIYLMYYNGKIKHDNKHLRQEDVFIVKQGQRQIYATDENYFVKLHVSKIPFYTDEQQERLRKAGNNLIISPIPAIYSDNDSLFSLKNIEDPEETYFKRITDNKMYSSLIDWVFDHQKVPELFRKEEIKEEYDKLVRFIFSTYIKATLDQDV